MVKRWSGWLLCILLVFVLGTGCATVAPNQAAPSQSGDYKNGDKSLYKYPEHDFNEGRMD
ncbi:hypothetical protein [Nitrospina gracilis]|uniref:hypothetical protein n=1 Tax=Nitrospina gracilis TaxID=35801 RepID=UPI001F43E0D9|nr:hypothetical protein [Nitrospina gracilis]MCF8719969.1 hypothetical protein [Nitrospina gracilis Nb-211]